MIGKTNGQGSLIQLVSLEELVPQEHFLRNLDRVLDLSFISKFLSPAYHPTHGRKGIVPALAMRMILVGYLYDLSEVRLCQEVGLHAGYRWFCRLDFHDPVPAARRWSSSANVAGSTACGMNCSTASSLSVGMWGCCTGGI